MPGPGANFVRGISAIVQTPEGSSFVTNASFLKRVELLGLLQILAPFGNSSEIF
jgi:hypothetical protein